MTINGTVRTIIIVLTFTLPMAKDAKEKEGGPVVEHTSGNPILDQKALAIVRRAAPFGPFPAKLRTPGKSDVWIVITKFNFTREDVLESTLSPAESADEPR